MYTQLQQLTITTSSQFLSSSVHNYFIYHACEVLSYLINTSSFTNIRLEVCLYMKMTTELFLLLFTQHHCNVVYKMNRRIYNIWSRIKFKSQYVTAEQIPSANEDHAPETWFHAKACNTPRAARKLSSPKADYFKG